MFGPNNNANPTGTAGAFDFRKKLMAALMLAGKSKGTNPYKRIAELFYASQQAAIQILPYITPKLRTLEVSGEVQVPFKFIVEQSDGTPVPLPEPQPVKRISSEVVVNPIKLDKCSVAATCVKHVKAKRKRPSKATRMCTATGKLAEPLSQARLSALILTDVKPTAAARRRKDHK